MQIEFSHLDPNEMDFISWKQFFFTENVYA